MEKQGPQRPPMEKEGPKQQRPSMAHMKLDDPVYPYQEKRKKKKPKEGPVKPPMEMQGPKQQRSSMAHMKLDEPAYPPEIEVNRRVQMGELDINRDQLLRQRAQNEAEKSNIKVEKEKQRLKRRKKESMEQGYDG